MSKIKIIGQEIKCPKCGFIQFFDIEGFKHVECFDCGNHFDLKKKMVKSNLIRREDIIKFIEKEIEEIAKEFIESCNNLSGFDKENMRCIATDLEIELIKRVKGDEK